MPGARAGGPERAGGPARASSRSPDAAAPAAPPPGSPPCGCAAPLVLLLGLVVVVVVAFALWYELESHALGSAGPGRDRTSSARGVGRRRRHRLSAQQGDRQHAGLPSLRRGPRHPDVTPGGLPVPSEPDLRPGAGLLNARAQRVIAHRRAPGRPLREIADRVGALPGTTESFAQVASSGAVHSTSRRPARTPGGIAGHRDLQRAAGGDRPPPC